MAPGPTANTRLPGWSNGRPLFSWLMAFAPIRAGTFLIATALLQMTVIPCIFAPTLSLVEMYKPKYLANVPALTGAASTFGIANHLSSVICLNVKLWLSLSYDDSSHRIKTLTGVTHEPRAKRTRHKTSEQETPFFLFCRSARQHDSTKNDSRKVFRCLQGPWSCSCDGSPMFHHRFR
jgi:hypothetical protein